MLPSDDSPATRARHRAPSTRPLLAGRTDLPPLTTDATAPNSRSSTGAGRPHPARTRRPLPLVAEDGYLRASADQPGGWVVQETFPLEPHGNGHLLQHAGTGRASMSPPTA